MPGRCGQRARRRSLERIRRCHTPTGSHSHPCAVTDNPGSHSRHCPVAGKDIWLGSTPGVYRLRRSAATAGGCLVPWRRPGRCADHPTSPIIDLTAARRGARDAQDRCLSPPTSGLARFLTVAARPRRGTCRRPRSTGRAGRGGGSGRHRAPRLPGPDRCATLPAAAPSASPAAPGAGSACEAR